MKEKTIRLLLVMGGVFLGLFLLEAVIRISLFTDYLNIPKVREISLYTDYKNTDYWKLLRRKSLSIRNKRVHFRGKDVIHPILGWTQTTITPKNPFGLFENTLRRLSSPKKHILFYGDSFVKGASVGKCEICNFMTEHLDKIVVADLGCPCYGLDQIMLSLMLTHKLVPAPFIIIGVLIPSDMERTTLAVRHGQKPYFVVNGNRLVLQGTPIDPNPEHYFKTHPPQIKSYVFQLIYQNLIRKIHFVKRKASEKALRTLNGKIIEQINTLCVQNGYPLVFVLFYGKEGLGRTVPLEFFLKEKLRQLKIPWIDTKGSLTAYIKKHDISPDMLYVENGHHNDLGNEIIARNILEDLSKWFGFQIH